MEEKSIFLGPKELVKPNNMCGSSTAIDIEIPTLVKNKRPTNKLRKKNFPINASKVTTEDEIKFFMRAKSVGSNALMESELGKVITNQERVRQNYFPSINAINNIVTLREFLENSLSIPPTKIPNSIFARKHHLIEADAPLRNQDLLYMMPTAEDRVKWEAARQIYFKDKLSETHSDFRGALTPQLWYDGGLDYSW